MNFSLKDLIKENLKLFEGRREDAQAKYTDVPERIFNIFVEEEPSGNYKYLDWIMKIWQQEMCGYSSSYRCGNVSVAKNMMNNISYFNENPHKYEIKDINGFTSFANFTNSTNDAKLKLTKGELKKQATKHYETGRYLIVEPHSHASSCFYGGGTQWCTTSRNYSDHFNNYYKTNSLLYFINKNTGKKRAFLTQLGRPMFGPIRWPQDLNWLYVGDKEYDNYGGQIFTETDNMGRSFRGIPIDAREAMQEAHKEKTKKWVKNLEDGERKYKLMKSLGMDDELPQVTIMNSWNDANGNNRIPDTIVEITNSFIVVDNDSFGNVKIVGELHLGCMGAGLSHCVNKVDSVQTVNDSLTIMSPNVDLGSLTGHIPLIKIKSDASISRWGGITSVGELQTSSMYENFMESIKDIPIDNLIFSQEASEKLLKQWIKKIPAKNVEVRRWMG